MKTNRRTTPRRGVASLELVLVFPLLLACAAGVMYAGRAGQSRTAAAVDVRRSSWEDRNTGVDPNSLSVFYDVGMSHSSSANVGHSFKAWKYGPKTDNPKNQLVAWGHSDLFNGSWNYVGVPF